MDNSSKIRKTHAGKGIEKNRKKNIIYLVPHTHYDAVWIFTKEDYFHINAMILKKAVELLEKYEEFRFLLEQTHLLEEIERREPELFKKLAKFIGEGKIEVADGEYLMADTMIPQEETLIREILVGKRYVQEKFGKDVEVMWQADSFGLNAQLPQIYRKAGYKYVAFRRGSPEIKPSEFIWEALDGTRILAHFMPLGYRAGLDLDRLEESYRFLKGVAASPHILMPCGSGVTLPRDEIVDAVKKWNKEHEDAEMRISTPSEFFRALEKYRNDLVVRKGEMYSGKYSEIFPDTASSRIKIKKTLRALECKLVTLEKFATVNFLLTGRYPEHLEDCWKKLLFLAFHDVISGTSTDTAFEEAERCASLIDKRCEEMLREILSSIVESDSNGEMDADFVVFNPLPWRVFDWVEVELELEAGRIRGNCGVLLESGDKKIDVEVIASEKHGDGSIKKIKLGFIADVPPLGYRAYRLIEKGENTNTRDKIRVNGDTIRNRFFEVKVNRENGMIEVWMNKKMIFGGNELVIEEESGDLYSHRQLLKSPIKTESGYGIKYGEFRVKEVKVTASNLRAIIDVAGDYFSLRWPYRLVERFKPLLWRYSTLSFRKRIVIYRDLPRIDCTTTILNKHPRMRLRVRFTTPINNKTYWCETQFGVVERRADLFYDDFTGYKEAPSGVYPALRWIAYEDDGGFGVAVINRGIPENEVRDGSIYLTLLRSVNVLSCDGKAGPIVPVNATELGEHVFEYALLPYTEGWRKSEPHIHGYQFNHRMVVLRNKIKCSSSRSFLEVEPSNVVLSAFKRSEDGRKIMARIYETTGRETRAVLKFFRKVKGVSIVDLLENKYKKSKKNIKFSENKLVISLNPFEITTVSVRF